VSERRDILFITSTRIGDAVLATGALRHLAEAFPDARFTIACGPLAAGLFEGLPGLVRIHVMTKLRNGGHWTALWRAARGTPWATTVDLRGSLVSWGLDAKRRFVLRGERPDAHKADEAARAIGLDAAPPLWLPIPSDHAARGAVLAGDRPFIAFGAGANWIGKRWAPAHFATLARALTHDTGPLPGHDVGLFGGPGDADTAAAVMAAAPEIRWRDLTGTHPLLTVAAALRKAALFVGNDSGLMHMAAAVETRTIGLFGPSNEVWYGPRGPHAVAVREGRSFDDFRRLDPRLNGPVSLMDDLRVETVYAKALILLKDIP
jgi:heptosyltransferase III